MKNISKKIFKGVATALITPFKNGKIDYGALEMIIEHQINEGIDALLVCGTTGESATLSDKEMAELISFSASRICGRVPLIAGSGSNDTAHAVRLSKVASELGANALLVVTPYYNKASREGLIRHYETVADNTPCPIIIYNVPSRTGVNIPIDVYDRLADHENIVGVKEASGSVTYLEKIISTCSDRLDIYSGNDDLILPTLSIGGSGVISVISNLLPKRTRDICELFFEGDIIGARNIQNELLPLMDAIFSEVNPIPIKMLMAERGFCREEYRLPLCPLEQEKKDKILKIAERYL